MTMKSTWADSDLSCDAFLGGRLSVLQPRRGYRAGVDPVLMAAAVPAKPGQSVLELGCGVGVASLCLAARVEVAVTGLELQPDYADLAARNAAANKLDLAVQIGDLTQMPAELRAQNFDHVIANPPYYDRTRGTESPEPGRETALGGAARLPNWIDAAVRRLKPKGFLTMICRADRLPDILSHCDDRVGDLRVKPIAPRHGRAAELFILQARKGARGHFRLLSPLVMHEGDRHERDGESYRAEVKAILRDAAPLEIV